VIAQTVSELDNKTAHRQLPVLDRHIPFFFGASLIARKITFRTASSVGNTFRFLMAARIKLFSGSIESPR